MRLYKISKSSEAFFWQLLRWCGSEWAKNLPPHRSQNLERLNMHSAPEIHTPPAAACPLHEPRSPLRPLKVACLARSHGLLQRREGPLEAAPCMIQVDNGPPPLFPHALDSHRELDLVQQRQGRRGRLRRRLAADLCPSHLILELTRHDHLTLPHLENSSL